MSNVVINAEVDEFKIGKIKNLISTGVFANEQEFFQTAIDEMIKKVKIERLNNETDKFASEMAVKHPKNLGESIVEARKEEDDRL